MCGSLRIGFDQSEHAGVLLTCLLANRKEAEAGFARMEGDEITLLSSVGIKQAGVRNGL